MVQGVAGNKKGELEVETQFLSKLHTNNGKILLKLQLKGAKNEAEFLKVTVSYCPRPPVYHHQARDVEALRSAVLPGQSDASLDPSQ
jgi:hypothetical protein